MDKTKFIELYQAGERDFSGDDFMDIYLVGETILGDWISIKSTVVW
jgi:hypothetical protein